MTQPEEKTKETSVTLEGGTYEIIRGRLENQGRELRSRLEKLNAARREIFGAIEHSLIATERITTQNNCLPRDMVPIPGNRFIFGYNVHLGLKSEIQVTDVFSVYDYQNHTFARLPEEVLKSGRFEEDMKNLYKYYKETQFAKFSVIGPHLFMVFRVGKSFRDIKAFKWLIKQDGIVYLDNRSDHEFTYPAQHEFEWSRTTRDMHRAGEHPHISIKDRVFVEAVGGDITFKVEDNTESGQGIYAEPVENPDQTLDDAEISYAILGHLILVRIRPYQENHFRHFIFNEKTQEVVRVDEIKDACVLLPDDQGLIFSNGYYLQTGELKKFDSHLTDMTFERRLASPNGEDFLFVFYNQERGGYILLSYNLIEQKIVPPIFCNGYSHFDNGEMIFFRADGDPARHHVIQIWQTPYVSGEHALSEKSDAYLYKVGNPGIVRCMAECNELLKMIGRENLYASLYVDMVKKASGIADAYFWIDKPETFNLKEIILQVKEAASGAIEEYEKVTRIRKNTQSETSRVSDRAREILRGIHPGSMNHIDEFVKGLAGLRGIRGEIIALKDLRYADLDAVEKLDAEVSKMTGTLSGMCVEFLLKPESLEPYDRRVTEIGNTIGGLTRMTEAQELEHQVAEASAELEMLIEIVSNLKIEDATQTTRIIDGISAIYSRLNQTRAGVKNQRKSLQSVEGTAQFNAQMKLLNQSVVNYLDICDVPEKCDEYLTKIMVSVEEIEGRFADFDEFIVQLSEKRDEVYSAFESRKISLVESRNKRAGALMSAAERILKGIKNRISGMDDINAIHGYFASDLMIGKVRDIVDQLLELNDTVKADDIQSRLKTIREDTIRQLKDRKELFVGGANVIQFGRHQFTVNVQPLDLTMIYQEGRQVFHLTGTHFFETVTDDEFLKTRPVWDMEAVSETREVYRGEYLAFQILKEFEAADAEERDHWLALDHEGWTGRVQAFMSPRYAEGYTKGVHDQDAARIARELAQIQSRIGLLRFHPRGRALARVFWAIYFQQGADEAAKSLIADKLQGFGIINELFPGQEDQEHYIAEMDALIRNFIEKTSMFGLELSSDAARYLFHELIRWNPDGRHFVISPEAWSLAEGFFQHLKSKLFVEKFKEARKKIRTAPLSEFELIRDWVKGYASTLKDSDLDDYLDEASAMIFTGDGRRMDVVESAVSVHISGMTGGHAMIKEGIYHLNYIRFTEKLRRHEQQVVPLFNRYADLKKRLTDQMREELRLEEFRPRVLTSFVRNRLINQVYLPLIGDNLAKQIGVAGEGKRTDLMGMLLVISPPGYGKTTLMEYIANRLGIIFMKINGPAIGYHVTSLDPAEAPNASAREEVEKINLALEMGDNIMIYLDDIQHCNPELLQKFISLCDAQRKIEGVYKGKSRTYDLRGKKVVVVMAGNPYTESGEKFKIPDMLANRADTYNLGDIIGDTGDVFKMSYLENALTSNPSLNRLASRSQKDVYAVIRLAETGDREGIEFEGAYSAEELTEMVSVMKKLITLREIILKVNKEYIYSAAQADEYRTEPPFKLQGSYRNMNRIAGKIPPIMNADELKTLILSHYENEAQTLTTGAEANILKFKELTGWQIETEKKRWAEIKKTFQKNQVLRGADASDPVMQVVAQLSAFHDGLLSIKETLGDRGLTRVAFTGDAVGQLESLTQAVKSAIASAGKDAREAGQIPNVYLKILKAQFDLMNSWMEPIFKTTQSQTREMQKLSQDIQNLKSVYREIIQASGESDWGNIEKLDAALKVNPHDHKTYYKRGMALYNKNELHRAVSDFKNALDLEPKNKKYQRIVAHLEAELTTDKVKREGEG